MSENLLQTLQQLVQDVIAPDVRELKVRVSSLEKQIDIRFDAMEHRLIGMDHRLDGMDHRLDNMDHRLDSMDHSIDNMQSALERRLDSMQAALLAAISESRVQSELTGLRLFTSLSERVAVLEARSH